MKGKKFGVMAAERLRTMTERKQCLNNLSTMLLNNELTLEN